MRPTEVGVADLKNRLSHYLRLVRRGQEIVVTDRGRVIARIEPCSAAPRAAGAEAQRAADLEHRGVLRRPRQRLTAKKQEELRRERPRADLVDAVLEERAEGR